MAATSLGSAIKHVELAVKIKQIVEAGATNRKVYLATHSLLRHKEAYLHAERATHEEFWSIIAWMPSSPQEIDVKHPDLVVIRDDHIEFFIEVKWGGLEDAKTDFRLDSEEQRKIKLLVSEPSIYCKINGPVGRNRPKKQLEPFSKDRRAQVVVVTKLLSSSSLLYSKQKLWLDWWKDAGAIVANIDRRVGDIPSLREVFENE